VGVQVFAESDLMSYINMSKLFRLRLWRHKCTRKWSIQIGTVHPLAESVLETRREYW